MTQLLVQNLSDEVHDKLQRRAQSHGRTVEDEVKEILHAAVSAVPGSDVTGNLGTRIHAVFAEAGGLDELIPELRGWTTRPAEFDP